MLFSGSIAAQDIARQLEMQVGKGRASHFPNGASDQSCLLLSVVVFIFNFFNVFIYLRERDRTRVGEGQRERETQNPKQAPASELSAQSPTRHGAQLTNHEIMT